VQVRDLPPGAADALVRVLEGRDESLPGRGRGADRRDRRAALREQLVEGRRDMAGLDLREARQTGKIK
jgi:hypothetical protein